MPVLIAFRLEWLFRTGVRARAEEASREDAVSIAFRLNVFSGREKNLFHFPLVFRVSQLPFGSMAFRNEQAERRSALCGRVVSIAFRLDGFLLPRREGQDYNRYPVSIAFRLNGFSEQTKNKWLIAVFTKGLQLPFGWMAFRDNFNMSADEAEAFAKSQLPFG